MRLLSWPPFGSTGSCDEPGRTLLAHPRPVCGRRADHLDHHPPHRNEKEVNRRRLWRLIALAIPAEAIWSGTLIAATATHRTHRDRCALLLIRMNPCPWRP